MLREADPLGRLNFLLDSVVLFDRLEAIRKTISLRLPPAVPVHEPAGRYAPAALRDWVRAEAAELAAKFDARNGNDHFVRQLRRPRGAPSGGSGRSRSSPSTPRTSEAVSSSSV